MGINMQETETHNIILHGQNTEKIPRRIRKKKECPFSLFFFDVLLEILAREIRQKKKKMHTNRNERSQIIPA